MGIVNTPFEKEGEKEGKRGRGKGTEREIDQFPHLNKL